MEIAITPTQARTALVTVRGTLGVGALFAPRLTGKLFGIDTDQNPAAVYLARLFGARELFMAAPFLMDDADELQSYALKAGVAVDGADVVAAVTALTTKTLSTRAATMAAVTALIAVALGLIAQQDD